MVSPRIAFVFLLSLSVALGIAEMSGAQDAVRIRWIYDKGNFNNTKANFWKETKVNGDIHYFVEVYRNQDFIEVYDASRELHCRLYKTKAFVKAKDGDWSDLFDGKWEK